MIDLKCSYQGNINLKRKNIQEEYTEDQIREIIKCRDNPVYFIRNYLNIINLDEGLIKFDLYDFQEKLIDILHSKKRIIGKLPRQVGKCCEKATMLNICINNNETKMTIKELYDKF